jgi:hypothetical protein
MQNETSRKLQRVVASTETVGRPRSRKPKSGELINVNVNLDGGLILALDEEAKALMSERPGLSVTRTDVIRIALNEWVAARTSKRAK